VGQSSTPIDSAGHHPCAVGRALGSSRTDQNATCVPRHKQNEWLFLSAAPDLASGQAAQGLLAWVDQKGGGGG
jgi:hypothetical protein